MGRKREPGKRLSKATVIAVAAMCMILGLAVWGMLYIRDQMNREKAQSITPVAKTETKSSYDAQELLDLLWRAVYAESPQEMAKFYRLGEANAEDAYNYLLQQKLPNREAIALSWFEHSHQSHYQKGYVVSWRLGARIERRLAAIVEDESGTLKVDYGAFARVSIPDWNKIIGGKENTGTARVVFKADNYYNGRFDEADWDCYKLTSGNGNQSVYGYARNQTNQASALKAMISRSLERSDISRRERDPALRAILEIEREERDLPNQFEIKRVLAPDWVMGEKPFDESF